MTRLLSLLRRVDLTDVALLTGLALLWIGLGQIAAPLPFIVVGGLVAAYGALPLVLAVRRRH